MANRPEYKPRAERFKIDAWIPIGGVIVSFIVLALVAFFVV